MRLDRDAWDAARLARENAAKATEPLAKQHARPRSSRERACAIDAELGLYFAPFALYSARTVSSEVFISPSAHSTALVCTSMAFAMSPLVA